jgi:hypothetical protein
MKYNILFVTAFTTLSTLCLAAANNQQSRIDKIDLISAHAQSFEPAANSHSENSWQVRERSEKSVIAQANSICENKGGKLINFSAPYVKKSPDTIYGSHAIYHSYIAVIDHAECEVNLEKEREVQTKNLRAQAALLDKLSDLSYAELIRGVESDKRKYALIDKWKKVASDEKAILSNNSICDFIYEQRGSDSYANDCYAAAKSAHLTQSSIRIALAATINNVAYAPEFIKALDRQDLSEGVSKILFYASSRHQAYGKSAVDAALGKIYTAAEESECLSQTERNYAMAMFCLAAKGRKLN